MATIQASTDNSTWVDLPELPLDGLTLQICDVDASTSGRDNTGLIHRDKIGMKRKLNCSWKYLTRTQVKTITDIADNTFFYLRFYDDLATTDGSLYTGQFYAGDRSGTIYSHCMGSNKTTPMYSSYTVNFIER